MGEGLVILFLTFFAPLLFSIIFLLFRFSSRFGYSFITLRSPLLAVAVSAFYTVLVFFVSSLFEGVTLYWACGVLILAMIVLWVIDSRYLHKLARQRKAIVKKFNTNRQVVKVIARAALVIILAPVMLFTLLALWTTVTSPIFDKFDHDKFITLDTQMQRVYKNLKTASNGADEWKYRTVCSPNRSGWMETGTYNCIVSISTEKIITSVDELNGLQAKYYPIISVDSRLKLTSAGLKPVFGFGNNFSVSLAYSEFVEKKTNIECTYEINLHQIEKNINHQTNNDDPGSAISGEHGDFYISFRCDETARSPWYQLVQDTSMLIPE